jgi:multiple sugar transport system ATP-binding protein
MSSIVESVVARSAASLEIVDLTKRFGDFAAVNGVSFDVEPGSLVALLGPSGCGKTTILRMIVGIETPTSGKIGIDGRDVSHQRSSDRGVGLVFQDFAIFPHLTVRDNIGFALRMRGEGAEERDPIVEEMAGLLELTGVLNRKPRSLNPSELQRVSIGRTLVARPAVMLFDEPLSNVEAGLRTRMRAELRTLHKRLGQTAVYVTHDQIEAMALADQVAVMNGGRLVQFGTPRELYDRPADASVAGFIGSPPMNLVDAVVENGHARRGPLAVPIPTDVAPDGTEVRVGVRPEHVKLATDADGRPIAQGTVAAFEFMGSEATVTVVGDDWQLAVLVDGHERRGLSEGSTVPIVVDDEHVHWFARDGRRLDGKRQSTVAHGKVA